MNKVLKLSIKNLTRQKRRNAVLAIAIAFGFFVVTMLEGFVNGMVENMENTAIEMFGGSVVMAGYEKEPPAFEGGKSKLINVIRDKDYMSSLMEKSDIDYESYSSYSMTGATLLFNGKKVMTNIFGRDMSDEKLLKSFDFIEGGLENLSDPYCLFLDDNTAESLNVKIGDQVICKAVSMFGQQNIIDLTIGGIYRSNSFMSSMQAYAHMATVNELIGIPEDGYTNFAINLKNKKHQEAVANEIEEMLRADGKNVSSRAKAFETNPSSIGTGIDKQFTGEEYQWDGVKYGVEAMNDEIPQIKVVLGIVNTVTTIILLAILLIVMVGVSNTYRMVLYERIREIGTMRAIGMTGKDTKRVFTYEAVILCIIGALAGIIFSGICMTIISLIPIHNDTLNLFLLNGHFSFKMSFGSIIVKYILLIILTTWAVRGSAKQAARMSPAEALRTVK